MISAAGIDRYLNLSCINAINVIIIIITLYYVGTSSIRYNTMLIHCDALIDFNNMGNIILRKSNTHHHQDCVGRHSCLRFECRTFYNYLPTYLPIHIYNNCAVENVPKKKIINKLVSVRKHIIIIRLWLENFLVGINFSVFANQPAKDHKPVRCTY